MTSNNVVNIEKICERIVNGCITSEVRALIVACSGGADSMALLNIMRRFCSDKAYALVCAHVNHGIRGAESDAEEIFLENYCLKHGIQFVSKRVDTLAELRSDKSGLEAVARRLRYNALREIADLFQPSRVLVAHNQNDQAETLLLQLLRGAGTTGLAAMQTEDADIVRPLLTVGRSEIERYCRDNGIEYCTDSSNNDSSFLRNRVRQQLLPQLAEYNPSIVRTLCRTAEIIRADNDYLEQVTSVNETECVEYAGSCAVIDKRRLISLHVALQRRIIRRIIQTIGFAGNLSFEKVEELRLQALSGRVSSVLEIGGGFISLCCYNHLKIEPRQVSNKTVSEAMSVELTLPGTTCLADGRLIAEIISYSDYMQRNSGHSIFYFDYQRLKLPLLVRTRKSGDMIRFGFGTKSLKKYFIDKKISVSDRENIQIICDSEAVLAVPELQASAAAEISATTTEILKITYIKEKKNA